MGRRGGGKYLGEVFSSEIVGAMCFMVEQVTTPAYIKSTTYTKYLHYLRKVTKDNLEIFPPYLPHRAIT